ncbi:MAG: glycosyltransferase family 4 protein [bacterium]|nr:glycosyltransferase family 4 protein [bacterium]
MAREIRGISMDEKKQNKRILVFSPLYPPHIGGLQSHAREFNKYLSMLGYDITVFTPQLPFSAKNEELVCENNSSRCVRVIRFPAFELISNYPVPKFWQPLFWRQVATVRTNKYSIIISRTRFFFSSLLAGWYAKTNKVRWVHIEHGSDFPKLESVWKNFVAVLYDKTLGKLVLWSADVVVANSQASAGFVKEMAGRECKFIYRGVDKAEISVTGPVALNLPQGSLLVVFVGRLISGKGVADLLNALKVIDRKEVFCFIVGDGPQTNDLKSIAQGLGLDKVVFLGEKVHHDTIALIKRADIVINPSYTEGLPTSIIEAALCGKAIIATDVGGTKEIVDHNLSGLLYKPRDVFALVSLLRDLLDNPAKRERLGNGAFQKNKDLFDWEKASLQYVQLFNTIE